MGHARLVLLALLFWLTPVTTYAFSPPPSSACDGAHALGYSTATNSFCTTAITGGPVALGTSAATANPQRSGQAGTGFYSDNSNEVEVAINGTQDFLWYLFNFGGNHPAFEIGQYTWVDLGEGTMAFFDGFGFMAGVNTYDFFNQPSGFTVGDYSQNTNGVFAWSSNRYSNQNITTMISNPSSGVASIDTITPGNALGSLNLTNLFANGLIEIGTATSSSSNRLNVYGAASIGTGYVNIAAPTNGAIIQGNVGIGTNFPNAPLEVDGVHGTGGGNLALILNPAGSGFSDIVTNDNSAGLRLYGGTSYGNGPAFQIWPTGSGFQGMYFDAGSAGGADIFFRASPGGAASIILKQGTGKIGIGGVTGPLNALDVQGAQVIGASYAGANTAPSNGLLVQGSVGLGTTSPSSAFEVVGTSTFDTLVGTGTRSVVTSATGVISAAQSGSGAEQTISYQPGLLSAVNATKGVYGKFVKASTVDNIEASAITFSCIANPTITLFECGTSSTCATSPVTIGTAALSAAGQVFDGTISNAAITAGDYVAWAITAGTCASIDVAATAQVHAN